LLPAAGFMLVQVAGQELTDKIVRIPAGIVRE
jgi:hypothetical protein